MSSTTAVRPTLLNGPNLNPLRARGPHIYGITTLAAIEAHCRKVTRGLGTSLTLHQFNHEEGSSTWCSGLRGGQCHFITPVAPSITSIALVDALRAYD